MSSLPQLEPHATEFDMIMMRRTLELAALGTGLVSPNPLVGCIVVSAGGEVVGEGTYIYDEVTHAEAIALEQAGEAARGGTAYISLEPHDHHGKTPPCTGALISAGIKRVVCPIDDPNPLVSGRGFEALRAAGVEVITGVLAEEAARQNEKFICWHKNQRPFVHLKLATSLDGRISMNGSVSTTLSGGEAAKRVHELRHEYDAILIGSNTAAVDDPQLTDRSEMKRRRPLVRVVLDNRLRLSANSRLAATAKEIPTLVFTNSRETGRVAELKDLGVEVVKTDMGARDLRLVLEELKNREIQSVLVEGGTEMAGSFCDERLVDKFTFIYSPLIIGGREAPNAIGGAGADNLTDSIRLTDLTVERFGDDVAMTGYPSN
jgi:diaminohydroxyphosphoribosylaminopyrimidine deaminase/5-amino-6-(5-phosphoribosylamino)uracil reductase